MPGVRIVEQLYQGEQGFVAKSSSTGAYFRFRPAEARVMFYFDGERSIEQIVAELANEGLNVTAASVDGFATKLGTLGLVERTLVERTSAQLERLRSERKDRRRQPLFRGELLRMRWRVGNPRALLGRTLPWLQWCFTPPFIYGSIALFVTYALIVGSRWSEVSSSFGTLMSPSHLTLGTGLLFWVSFIFIGFVHEMGHAYTCAYFSGDVDDMGVMIIYFQPAFYCNVNDAWSFPDLRHRLWVTAAGGWIELVLASFAAIVWAVAEPGTLIANTALIITFMAGGLTLISNANPLLPYDGYFALSDWLEIPNLRLRANAYFRWWLSANVLQRTLDEPAVTERERRIFLTYGSASAAYTVFVIFLLSTLLIGWATRTFGATVVVIATMLWLVARRDRVRTFYFAMKQGAADLYRASLTTRVGHLLPERLRGWGGLAVALLIVLILPWSRSVDGGWVALPTRYVAITAPTDGVVDRVFVTNGIQVAAGAPLIHLSSLAFDRARPDLLRRRDSLLAVSDIARARTSDAVEYVNAAAVGAAARLSELDAARASGAVRAPSDGVVLTARPEDLLGRSVVGGTPLLQLGATDSVDVRITLRGGGASAVAEGQAVSLILDADAAHPLMLRVVTVSPVADSSRGADGAVEARVRVAATSTWRPGARGAARVTIDRGTVFGALAWAVRTRIRSDLLL